MSQQMSASQTTLLHSCAQRIANDIDWDGHILSHLMTKGILRQRHVNELLRTHPMSDRALLLLSILQKRGAHAFNHFYASLLATDQPDLAELLKPSVTDFDPPRLTADESPERDAISAHSRSHIDILCQLLNDQLNKFGENGGIDNFISVHFTEMIHDKSNVDLTSGRWRQSEELIDDGDLLKMLSAERTKPLNIIIEADAGFGKSYLLHHFANLWCKRKTAMCEMFDLVLLVRLDHEQTTVEETINRICQFDNVRAMHQHFNTARVLVLLDAYDEYTAVNNTAQRFTTQWPLLVTRPHNIVVILTTRRHKTDDLVKDNVTSWLVLRLKGLKESAIPNYMHRSICRQECDTSVCERSESVNNMISELKHNDIATNPLFIMMACTVCRETNFTRSSMYGLVKEFLNNALSKYLSKNTTAYSIADFFEYHLESFFNRLALFALKTDTVVSVKRMDGADMKTTVLNPDYTEANSFMKDETMRTHALPAGILYQYNSVAPLAKGHTHFFHKLFAEFAIAMFLHSTGHYKEYFLLGADGKADWHMVMYFFLMHKLDLHKSYDINDLHLISKELDEFPEVTDKPLNWACSRNYTDIVSDMLDKWPEMKDTYDVQQLTPLMSAAQNRSVDCVDLLLEAGANVCVRGKFGLTAAGCAAISGDVRVLELLRIEADIFASDPPVDETSDKPQPTLLAIAAAKGHSDCCAYLLCKARETGHGYCLAQTNDALKVAIRMARVDCLARLSDEGVSIDQLDINSMNKAMLAMLGEAYRDADRAVVLRQLLACGAHLNCKDDRGYTPLMCAVVPHNVECVKVLLAQEGCLLEETDTKNGETALLMTVSNYNRYECARVLVEAGANINARTNQGKTPLMLAAEYGDVDSVRLLLDKKECDVNARDGNGNTALALAIIKKHNECAFAIRDSRPTPDVDIGGELEKALIAGSVHVARILIEKIVHPSQCSAHSQLLMAVCHSDVGAVRTHLSAASTPTVDGCTALMLALIVGKNREIINVLIDKKCAIDERTTGGWTAVMLAAHHGDHKSVGRLAGIKANLDLQITDVHNRTGHTALMLAAENGHVACVRELIAHGANVCVQQVDGRTALMMTFDDDCLVALANTRVSNNLQDEAGWTALMIGFCEDSCKVLAPVTDVMLRCYDDSTALMRFAERGERDNIRILLEINKSSEHINATDNDGKTALMIAAYRRHVGCTMELLTHGADAIAQDKKGQTALIHGICAEGNNIECVRLLIDTGVADTRTVDGWTPLMIACNNGQNEYVRLLLGAKCALDAQLTNGYTALMVAAQSGYLECVQLLIDAGADRYLRTAGGDTALSLAKEFEQNQVVALLEQAN